MDVPPQLPAVMGDADGAVTVFSSRYMRNAIAMAFEALGGAQGLVDWAASSADRLDQFYTKLAPKLVVKQIEVRDERSIEDVIDELDGSPHMERSVPPENVVDAEYAEHYS